MNIFRVPKPIRKVRHKARPGRLKGANLAKLRLDCFARDRALCRDCGQMVIFDAPHIWPNSYHMAHIQAKRRGGDNLSNVRTLCGSCHRKEHNAGGKPCPKKSPPPPNPIPPLGENKYERYDNRQRSC